MSVVFKFNDYDENNLYFVECVKNNVKTNSWFSRITYSNTFIALKNIYFAFTLKDVLGSYFLRSLQPSCCSNGFTCVCCEACCWLE